jgi:catechol 2,3-dioxygenase-like lactoylglutathione lyase family enzyme
MPIVPDMIGIVVADIPRSIAFYRLLGLPFADPAKDEDFVEVTVNGYRISLNAESLVRTLQPGWKKPVGQRHEVAFKCDSAKDVDATYAAIVAQGHRGVKEPWDAFWGQRYAVVADPDGSHVSLFAPLG